MSAKRSRRETNASRLTHFGQRGAAKMVDVSAKPVTHRTAVASGCVRARPETIAVIRNGNTAKGDVRQVARLAGIIAAKRTADWIPLCHTIPLAGVEIEFEFPADDCMAIRATAKADHRTGVEMEALTAVAATALTVYDMCKAIDREMRIESIQLEEKSGGARGAYRRSSDR